MNSLLLSKCILGIIKVVPLVMKSFKNPWSLFLPDSTNVVYTLTRNIYEHSSPKFLQFQPPKRQIDQRRPGETDVIPHLYSPKVSFPKNQKKKKLASAKEPSFPRVRREIRRKELTSAPYSPTLAAIGPIYHTCAMQRIAPAQPTRNATSAAIPSGNSSLRSHAAQS